jgi:hypothetical protein
MTVTDDCGCSFAEEFLVNDVSYQDAIVGRVWLDSLGGNANLYDMGEYLWSQLEVNLYLASDLANPIATEITDFSGFYAFQNLAADDYVIGTSIPQGLQLADFNVGMDDDIDSDIDPMTGYSATISAGDCVRVDIGLKEQ